MRTTIESATRLALFALAALAVACGGGEATDAGAVDAGFADTGANNDVDAGVEADAGEVDAGFADSGVPEVVGVISGPCGELDDELTSVDPSTFQNAIDFPMGYTMADEDRLSDGAQEILLEGTAGGSSGLSEAFSFEVLHRCEGAVLIKTETEVLYDPPTSKKTDILVQIADQRIGVSVTRAVGFPRDDPYSVEQAKDLLDKKLADILVSSANVEPADAWTKQILHVIAYGPMHADSMQAAALMVDPAVRADTILWITVTDGEDLFLY
ncbi:MAG: hypothetical protein KC933_14180 [Myxococcales bacterium]|nr:hypothetical protein [Myxococcales bacterium]MCB9652253.1 hypothetical protein [Deltaproteobacteria bacterium]